MATSIEPASLDEMTRQATSPTMGDRMGTTPAAVEAQTASDSNNNDIVQKNTPNSILTTQEDDASTQAVEEEVEDDTASNTNEPEEQEDDEESLATTTPVKATKARHDPFKLNRFIREHKYYFNTALREIKNGRKVSCWSWYIFPVAPWVVDGRERGSYTNQQYALRDLPPNDLSGDNAATAYLQLPPVDGVNLRQNYVDIMKEVCLKIDDEKIHPVSLVGGLDAPKMKSSLELFQRVSADGVDDEVHEICSKTLEAMAKHPPRKMGFW